MPIDLKGKVAIVTGAARGLGLVVARDLAREGMHIVGTDVREEELRREMKAVATAWNVKAVAVQADVAEETQVKELVRRALTELGQIDVLVNNAGVRQVAPVWEMDTATWDRIQSSNLKGQFLCTREVLGQHMLERDEGVLVFVSSNAGRQGNAGSSAYAASKWGVIGLAESVAKDLKKTHVRVTVITPSRIETPMARESEAWALGLDWLNPEYVSQGIVFCIKQDVNTIIPELRVYHRAQI